MEYNTYIHVGNYHIVYLKHSLFLCGDKIRKYLGKKNSMLYSEIVFENVYFTQILSNFQYFQWLYFFVEVDYDKIMQASYSFRSLNIYFT